MPSLTSRVMNACIGVLGADKPLRSAAAAEAFVRDVNLRPRPYGPPRRLRRHVTLSMNYVDGWPVYEVIPVGRSRGVTVYLHGGGWTLEILPFHWKLVARIAAEAGTRVVVPIYPLLPRGNAANVVARVLDLTRAETARQGANLVSICGDSAGGQIALSAALALRDLGIALRQTVLLCPAVDLALSNARIGEVEPLDPMLKVPGLRPIVELWRADLPVVDPNVSPLHGDMSGLGPMTVFSGTRDILSPDVRLMVDKARTAGVTVVHHEAPGQIHAYPALPTPEGRRARRQIVDALRA